MQPNPIEKPVDKPSSPRLVETPRRRSRLGWLALAAGAGLAGGAVWYATRPAPSTGSGGPPVAAVRTATVVAGSIDQTVRLTGSTGPTKYASIIVPMLRGSRSGAGRGGPQGSFQVTQRGGGGGGMQGMMMAMTGGGGGGMVGGGDRGMGGERREGGRDGGGGQGGGGGSSSSSSPAPSGPTITSTAGAGGGGSSALRAATTRVGGSSSGARSSGGGFSAPRSTISSSSSGSGGGQGGGPGGGGGQGGPGGGGGDRSLMGGGGGDFQMTVQNLAPAGSIVSKGDVVARFDDQMMLNRLDDYRASVLQTEMSYKKMLADLEVARKAHEQSIAQAKADLDKSRLNLQTVGVIGAIEAEKLRLAAEEAEARYNQLIREVEWVRAAEASDLKVADLEMQQARVELKRAESNAERMALRAPIDGMVVMESNYRGSEFDQIKEGDQLFPGQPFMKIVDPSSLIVNAYVNQVDAEKIRVGQRARVRFDAFPGLELPAHVYSLGAVPKSSRARPDFVKEIAVVLQLEKMDPRIIPDLSVSADVVVGTEQQASIAPREAVFQDGDGAYVMVKAVSGWEKRRVETGIANNLAVAIRKGVAAGEVIAAEPVSGAGKSRSA
jgi:HlyD family secretion protein